MDPIEQLRKEIERYRRAGAWRKVIELSNTLLEKLDDESDRVALMTYLAEIHLYQFSEHQAGLDWLVRAFELDPGSEKTTRFLQKQYQEQQKLDEELALLQKFCEHNNDPRTLARDYRRIATLLGSDLGRPEEAVHYLNLSLDETFRGFSAFEDLVRILNQAGNFSALESQYRKMISRTKSLTYGLGQQMRDIQKSAAATASKKGPVEVTGSIILPAELAEKVPQTIIIEEALYDRPAAKFPGPRLKPVSGTESPTADVSNDEPSPIPAAADPTNVELPAMLDTEPTNVEMPAVVLAEEDDDISEQTVTDGEIPAIGESIAPAEVAAPDDGAAIEPGEPPAEDAERELPEANWAAVEETHPGTPFEQLAGKQKKSYAVITESASRTSMLDDESESSGVDWRARAQTEPRISKKAIKDAVGRTIAFDAKGPTMSGASLQDQDPDRGQIFDSRGPTMPGLTVPKPVPQPTVAGTASDPVVELATGPTGDTTTRAKAQTTPGPISADAPTDEIGGERQPVMPEIESEPAPDESSESLQDFVSDEALLDQLENALGNEDYQGAAGLYREMIDREKDPERRFQLMLHQAELYRAQLADFENAEGVLHRALETRHDNRTALDYLLQLYLESGDGPGAMDSLNQLFNVERDPQRLAEYYFTMAQLYLRDFENSAEAVRFYNLALDTNPGLYQAFELLDQLLTAAADWPGLEENYRQMIKRVLPERDQHEEFTFILFHSLGELYRSRLMNLEKAAGAFEACVQMRPDDSDIREILGEIYEILGFADPAFIAKGIVHERELLARDPKRFKAIHAMFDLYNQLEERDGAWCVARVLAGLDEGRKSELIVVSEHSRLDIPQFKKALTREHWTEALFPAGTDLAINDILTRMSGSEYQFFPVQTPKNAKALGFGHQFRHVLQQVSLLFRLRPPEVYKIDGDRFDVLGKPIALLAGRGFLDSPDIKSWGFLIGHHMTRLLPDFYMLTHGVQTASDCLYAALNYSAGGEKFPETEAIHQIREHLNRLPIAEREALRKTALPLLNRGEPDVKRWVVNADLTANRVGFLVCDDFDVAVRHIRSINAVSGINTLSGIDAEEMVQDLTLFALSEAYFELRRYFGLEVTG